MKPLYPFSTFIVEFIAEQEVTWGGSKFKFFIVFSQRRSTEMNGAALEGKWKPTEPLICWNHYKLVDKQLASKRRTQSTKIEIR